MENDVRLGAGTIRSRTFEFERDGVSVTYTAQAGESPEDAMKRLGIEVTEDAVTIRRPGR